MKDNPAMRDYLNAHFNYDDVQRKADALRDYIKTTEFQYLTFPRRKAAMRAHLALANLMSAMRMETHNRLEP